MKNSQNFQSRLRFVRLWAVMRTGNLGGNNSAFLLDNSETCYFINSYDDLKAIYTGKAQMPSIDFESYTLIIGQKLSNNVYQNLDKQSFYERDGKTYLDLYFLVILFCLC
jgi:hypothetical protein